MSFVSSQLTQGVQETDQSAIASLVRQVNLLQSRFLSFQVRPVRRDISSVVMLARDAIASQSKWLQDGTFKETCSACFRDVPSAEQLEVPSCFHRLCLACVNETVKLALAKNEPIPCPSPDCEQDIPKESCAAVVDPNLRDLMSRRETESSIHFAERVYCPSPECSALMSRRELLKNSETFFSGAKEEGFRKCLVCGFVFCINCMTKWHRDRTCAEFRKTKDYKNSHDNLFNSVAEKENWKRCAGCRNVIVRDEGCTHVTCPSCHHEFCYTCGAEWKKKKATCKCVLRDLP